MMDFIKLNRGVIKSTFERESGIVARLVSSVADADCTVLLRPAEVDL